MRSASGTMALSSPAAKFVPAEAKYQNLDSSAGSSSASSAVLTATTNNSNNNRRLHQDAAENRAPITSSRANQPAQRSSSANNNTNQHQAKKDRYTVQFNGDFSLTTYEQIGKGGFARVFAARSNNGEWYALKVCENMNESTWRRLQEEVRILQMLSGHRNIVKLYAAARVENNAFLAMEKCIQRNLHDLVISTIPMKLDEVLWVGRQLATALLHIHHHNCIHRDLKPQNILFDDDGDVKVIDFGLSTRAGDKDTTRKTVAGTAIYMAPEMASHYVRLCGNDTSSVLSYGQEIDIWSYGIVLYVMATGSSPYWKTNRRASTNNTNANPQQNEKQNRNAAVLDAVSKYEWDWPPGFKGDGDLMNLIENILTDDKSMRPTLQDILSHRIFRRCPEYCPDSLKIKLGIISHVNNSSALQQDVAVTSPLSQRSANNNQHQYQPANNTRYMPSNNNRMLAVLNSESASRLQNEWARHTSLIVTQRCNELADLDEIFVCGCLAFKQRQQIRDEEYNRRMMLFDQLNDLYNRALREDAAAAATTRSSSRSHQQRGASIVINTRGTNNRRDKSVMIETAPTRPSAFRERNLVLDFDERGCVRITVPNLGDDSSEQQQQSTPRSSRLIRGGMSNRNNGGSRARSLSIAESLEFKNKFMQTINSSPRDTTIDFSKPLCLNGHVMKKHEKLPFYCGGYYYNEVACDSCKRSFKKLEDGNAVLRCSRCDFDVCEECFKDLTPKEDEFRDSKWIYCMTCNKAFARGLKYTNHAKRCKGPSCSPAREDGTARQTMMMMNNDNDNNNSSRSSSTASSTLDQDIPRAAARRKYTMENIDTSNTNKVDLGATSVADVIETNLVGGRTASATTSSSRSTSRRGVLHVDDDGEFQTPGEDDILDAFNTSRNNNRSNANNRSSTSRRSSTASRKSVSFANNQDAAAAPTSTIPDEDDDDLSPIQRAIRERHSQRMSDGGNNNNNVPRGSVLPQPAEIYEPKQQEQQKEQPPQLSYPDLLQVLAESKQNPFNRRRGTSSSRSRSRSVSSDTNNSTTNTNKVRRVEGDAGDQPARNQQQANRTRFEEINVPNTLTGTRTSRSRGRSIADMMKQNNVQGFNGPAGNSFTDDEQQQQRVSEQSGPFFLKTDRNGRQYFVDANGNPAQLMNANLAAPTTTSSGGSARRARSSRSQQQQPGPLNNMQGTIRRGGSASVNANTNNNNRGVSKPAARIREPSKMPERDQNGKFLPKSHNQQQQQQQPQQQQMMMNTSNNSGKQQQQQQQAFLALPRREEHRERFTREFLSGGWIRHYAFATNDVAFLYYSLQPGRYGAFFQRRDTQTNQVVTSTVVIDVHSRLVLYVPSLRGDGSRTRLNANGTLMPTRHFRDNHVETDYDEEARVMPLSDAQQFAGPAIGGILDYVNEITRMKAEGQVPIYVPAAHIQNAADGSVPANTKFVYLRRVFPDPGGSFALFRLSNMRSQIICNAQYDFDIRWQTEKNSKGIGMKYYVYRDGTAQPFSMDNTGLLSRVEKILSEQFLTRK